MQIGIIGVGKMGLSHLAIANQLDGIHVAAICDASKMLVNALSKNMGVKGYTDYKKMIGQEKLDAVLICVPNSHHYQIAKNCLNANLNIFIEKPLTLSASESSDLAALAEQKGLLGQVGYPNRFNPIFAHLKKLLSENIVGKILSYESRMIGGVVLKEQSKGWRNEYEKGGGCLFDYGPHCIDLAVFLFGEKVVVENAILQKVYSSKVDDIVFALLKHKNGPTGRIFVNWSDPTVRKAGNQIEIVGSTGKIIANKQEIKLYITEPRSDLGLSGGWNEIYITDLNTDVSYYLRGEDFSRQLESFSHCLHSPDLTPISTLHTGAVTDQVISDVFRISGELQ